MGCANRGTKKTNTRRGLQNPSIDLLSCKNEGAPFDTLNSGIGYLLFNLSVAKIGPTRTAGVVYSLVPVFVAILALLFFAEAITFVMIASGGLILIGLRLMMQSGSSSE